MDKLCYGEAEVAKMIWAILRNSELYTYEILSTCSLERLKELYERFVERAKNECT